MRHTARIVDVVLLTALGLGPAACRPANDANLETEEYAKSRISLDGPATARVTTGHAVQVEGPATNHDQFQHDVYFTATLLDASGRTVGTATGKLEDWPAGHRGLYKLVGTCSSPTWTTVTVIVSNVTEHVRGRSED
jgi:hypothetical protein